VGSYRNLDCSSNGHLRTKPASANLEKNDPPTEKEA
jgi:hypothetical protein